MGINFLLGIPFSKYQTKIKPFYESFWVVLPVGEFMFSMNLPDQNFPRVSSSVSVKCGFAKVDQR